MLLSALPCKNEPLSAVAFPRRKGPADDHAEPGSMGLDEDHEEPCKSVLPALPLSSVFSAEPCNIEAFKPPPLPLFAAELRKGGVPQDFAAEFSQLTPASFCCAEP